VKRNYIRTIIAAALLFCLAASLACPAALADCSAQSEPAQSISELIIPDDAFEIHSITELNALADKCRLDSWSRGKSIVLMCDVDVSNTDFSPIPSFGGTFYGNGHTISGLTLKGSYSPAGLFLELQETGLVRDLTVTGSVIPAGKPAYTGGIIGRNAGTVLNCRFIGSVSGNEDTGGIVGCNLATGVVSLCRVEGSVVGMSMTGGLVGLNEGTILASESDCRVNNVSVDPTVTLDDINLNLDLTDLSSIGKRENVPEDTGGIAGYCVGTIIGCASFGTTGYPHIGYNIGGIAGRNCGYITGCKSNGTVYGRKDVGGIVGQAEPWKNEKISESDVSILQGQVTAMQQTINQLQEDASNAGEAVSEELTNFEGMLGDVYASLKDIHTSVSISSPDINALMDKYFPEGGDGGGSVDIGGIVDNIGSGGSVTESIDRTTAETSMAMLDEYIAGTSAGARTDLSSVRDSVILLTDGVNSVNNAYTGHSTVIDNDLTKLTEQATELTETVSRILYADPTGSKVVDVSLVSPDLALLGKVGKCENYASVQGDYNVGGIVGTQANESSIDPEDDLVLKIDNAVSKEYDLVVLCTDCINYGIITAKMDYTGGIAGRIGLGAILRCENYGIVKSSSGDYVGGIAGQNSSTIKNSYAKCVLSGESYIGGITGYSTDENSDGSSGTVANCVAMVNIIAGNKYCGAVTGCESGEITDNFFVSDTLCGYNYVSKAGQAEPITYEKLMKKAATPKAFGVMHVYFMTDDTIVETADTAYGETINPEDIPTVPPISRNYGEWSFDAEQIIRIDTLAPAEYTPYVRTISSDVVRDDGKSAFYVQGIFAPDAILGTERVSDTAGISELPFRLNVLEFGREVIEQWKIEIPDDGNSTHTVRYRTPNGGTEHISIFRNTAIGWKVIDTEVQGSYLLFDTDSLTEEIVVVNSSTVKWIVIVGIVLGALLLVVLVYFVIKLHRLNAEKKKLRAEKKARLAGKHEKRPEGLESEETEEYSEEDEEPETLSEPGKKSTGAGRAKKIIAGIIKAVVVLAIAAILISVSVAIVAPNAVAGVLGAVYLERLGSMENRDMVLTVDAYDGYTEYELESEIITGRLQNGDTISCVTAKGIKLYYSKGVLFLENGNAYSLSELNGGDFNVAEAALTVFKGTQSTMRRDGGYTIITTSSESEDAKAILSIVMPEIAERLEEVGKAEISLYVLNNRISYIALSAAANTEDSRQFEIGAKLQIMYNSDEKLYVPDAVSTALENVRSGEELAPLKFNADMLSLLSAWGNFNQRSPQAASVSLKASSTILSVTGELEWFRKNVNGTNISCISTGSANYYLTEDKMCGQNGSSISLEQLNSISAANLIDTAFTLSQSIEPEVTKQDTATVYTIRITGDLLTEVAQKLVPQLKEHSVDLASGSVNITVRDGGIAAVSLTITGNIRTLIDIPVTISASAVMNNYITDAECQIPANVITALVG